MKDYYSVLRVSRAATLQDIKSAYKKYALKLHPDMTGNNEEKTRVFKQLTEAYNILSDSTQRQKYDSELGIRRIRDFYSEQAAEASTFRGKSQQAYTSENVKAPPPPPEWGGKVFGTDEWMAWHYGVDATPQSPLIRKNAFMDIKPDEKGPQYFIRQKTREAQGPMSSEDVLNRKKRDRETIVERMHRRRERRMEGKTYEPDAATGEGSPCTIS